MSNSVKNPEPNGAGASDSLAYLSIDELLRGYRAGSVSPVQAVDEALRRIERYNPSLNAFAHLTAERAAHEARESEKRWRAGTPAGPLDGIPVTVKDTLMVRGCPFRRGSLATSDAPMQESAPVVDHVLGSGAVLLGITTTPEFGSGPVTISPLTGITRNPWDTTKNSGGSSGGAAAATAAGIGTAALATDAGGSTRIPASLCGVVGFKPTGGRFPTYPPNVAGTLSSPGAIARSVRDAALMADVMAQTDLRDPEMLPPAGIRYADTLDDLRTSLQSSPGSLRIAFTTTMGYAKRVDPQVAQRVQAAARHFESLGFIVEEADPGIDNPVADFLTLFRSGFAYTLSRFSDEQKQLIGQTLRDTVAQGAQISVAQYLAAQDARRAIARRLHDFHRRYALLLTPTCAVPAFTADRWIPEGFPENESRAWTPFASVFNLTQQPAISIPCGLTAEGLPVGLQIAGPRFADANVLGAAHLYETTCPDPIGRPKLT